MLAVALSSLLFPLLAFAEPARINLVHRSPGSSLDPADRYELALASIRAKYAGLLPNAAHGRRAPAGEVSLTNLYADACVLCSLWSSGAVSSRLIHSPSLRVRVAHSTYTGDIQLGTPGFVGDATLVPDCSVRCLCPQYCKANWARLFDSRQAAALTHPRHRCAPPVGSAAARPRKAADARHRPLPAGSSDLWVSSSACTTCTGTDDLFNDAKSSTLARSSESFAICACPLPTIIPSAGGGDARSHRPARPVARF